MVCNEFADQIGDLAPHNNEAERRTLNHPHFHLQLHPEAGNEDEKKPVGRLRYVAVLSLFDADMKLKKIVVTLHKHAYSGGLEMSSRTVFMR